MRAKKRIKRVNKPVQDVLERWQPQQAPPKPEQISGGRNEFIGCAAIRRLVAQPVEQDRQVRRVRQRGVVLLHRESQHAASEFQNWPDSAWQLHCGIRVYHKVMAML